MAKQSLLTVRGQARSLPAIALALAILPIADAGKSEEAMIWTEKSSGGLTALAYGPLDPTASPLFVLSCFSGMNIVVLDVHKEIPGAKRGDAITIEISSAKAQAPVKAEVEINEATGTNFGEASDINVQPVLASDARSRSADGQDGRSERYPVRSGQGAGGRRIRRELQARRIEFRRDALPRRCRDPCRAQRTPWRRCRRH